jgi:hypothetical protein
VGVHIIRTGVERIPEKILNGKFHNKTIVGKPRTRKDDVVWRDTSHILGIQGWRRHAQHREERRHFLRYTRTQKGL